MESEIVIGCDRGKVSYRSKSIIVFEEDYFIIKPGKQPDKLPLKTKYIEEENDLPNN